MVTDDELKRQILDAYGYDDWTQEERDLFDAEVRLDEALKAEREAFAAAIPARMKALAPQLPELVAATYPELADGMKALAEAGVWFEWKAS